MGRRHLRYRVGIDVGLYSVGLSAIEIDDSSNDPRDAMPIKLLSTMSVIHDGGVDPEKAKEAISRKANSGVARRTRKMRKNKMKRLNELDGLLSECGYPLDQAKKIAEDLSATESNLLRCYPAWNARIYAAEKYIVNDKERMLAITVAVRHIARHRGWRNPYSSVESLEKASSTASDFYVEFFKKVQLWKHQNKKVLYKSTTVQLDEKGNFVVFPPENLQEDPNRPTVAELVQDFLDPQIGVRFRSEHKNKDDSLPTQIGKLHQSDYYYELSKIFETQRVPKENQEKLLEQVFQQKNPKDIGAAAKLVAKDSLPGQEKFPRASRASLAFQQYRILSTITNLRIQKEGKEKRFLTKEEIGAVYDFLCEKGTEETTWHDIAEHLKIERNDLKGVGGQTWDGSPISAKTPPILNTELTIKKATKKKELKQLKKWWEQASDFEKEFFIESLDNAGFVKRELSDEENYAQNEVNRFLTELSDEALQALEGISLASGRAAYSIDSLRRISKRMLEEAVDLRTALEEEFGKEAIEKTTANPLGTATGNPAVDRTITIVSRWLKACNKRWGKPETINIEHVRDGFTTPKAARKAQHDMDKRYQANQKIREEILSSLNEQEGSGIRGIEAIRHADIRRYQAVQRQNCKCIYCGTKITFQTAQMDHIVPRKGPGCSNELPNLVAACADCNKSKNNTLFYTWSKTEEKRNEVLKRVDEWNRDSYFSSDKQFKNYIKSVKARLKQKEEDEPLDNRSMASLAWMARELREQIEGFFEYQDVTTSHTEGNDDFSLQRVNVYRGSLTAEARKASGIEQDLPWIGNQMHKVRLDRRHHAVDASVIALMRPQVGKVLAEREALRRNQLESNLCKEEQFERYGKRFWKGYQGSEDDSPLYLHWRDEQMMVLRDLLAQAMENDRVVVTNYKRLRLGNGRAHEDTIYPLVKRHVGDALSVANIDKAATPALWMALTSHPDFDPKDGLSADPNRRIRIHGRWLDADDEIGFMENPKGGKDAVFAPVRKGFAAIGNTIHHARFYRIPKINSKGVQTGWQFAYLRVFQIDLLEHQKEDLFTAPLPPQSISRRSATSKLRQALDEGTAKCLGWMVVGDEIQINPDAPYFSPEGKYAINLFMKAFPQTNRFKISGFENNKQIALEPLLMSSEGISEEILDEPHTAETLYGNSQFNKKDIKNINTILGIGGGFHPSVDVLFNTHPTIIRRNTLGEIRWSSNNNMPKSWKVPPHPPLSD